MKILVTGGAGFIGSHLVDALVKLRHQVTVFDNLDPQIHGRKKRKPSYLNKRAKFILGDVRDLSAFKKALIDQEVLFHQAAAVGVGQSMYEIKRYTQINTLGAATVLQAVADGNHCLKKMVVASSMSLYGEGLYKCPTHGLVTPFLRDSKQLKSRQWDVTCTRCSRTVKQVPTPESKTLHPASIYATNKRDHEEMFLVVGQAYNIPAVALRYFNVYGSRQALSNPYTGAAAIFSSAMLTGKSPIIFEDGDQSRDFIHVSDIVQANILVMKNKKAKNRVYNVGTGRNLSLNHLVRLLAKELKFSGDLEILGRFRAGDIRHCYADIREIKKLGFKPKIRFEKGIKDLCAWVKSQQATSRSSKAHQELKRRGLTI